MLPSQATSIQPTCGLPGIESTRSLLFRNSIASNNANTSQFLHGTSRRWDLRYPPGELFHRETFRSCLVGEDLYLGCHRSVELKPVRAGMVECPGEHQWSSDGHNAQGLENALSGPHTLYAGLGRSPQSRQSILLPRDHADSSDCPAIGIGVCVSRPGNCITEFDQRGVAHRVAHVRCLYNLGRDNIRVDIFLPEVLSEPGETSGTLAAAGRDRE
mgnify:CR=1 FL=1